MRKRQRGQDRIINGLGVGFVGFGRWILENREFLGVMENYMKDEDEENREILRV